jgi:hypothetical protein
MQAELIIQHGQAKFTSPVYLKPTAKIRMIVEINDEDVVPTRDWYPEGLQLVQRPATKPDATNSPMQNTFNQILGDLALERPGASIGDDYQTLMEAYEERYNGH